MAVEEDDDARGLSQYFLSCLPAQATGAASERIPDAGELEQAVAAFLDAGKVEWPRVVLEPRGFLAFVATCLPPVADGASPGLLESLKGLRAADLHLVWGCAEEVPFALVEFEAHLQPVIEAALRRLRLPDAAVEELKQNLREQLFVTPVGKARPMICNYSGRGQLKNWLRTTAVRTATKWLDRSDREVPVGDDALDDAVGVQDPELDRLKEVYRAEFRTAFQEALRSLEGQERTVLLQHYIDGLNIDELGALYHVHRATAARWLTRGREALLLRTREKLMATLRVTRPEFESIMRMIQSRLGFTLRSFVGSSDE